MVLTRAQRAQTKATPPDSPSKSSILKAPVRRGRGKPVEAEVDTQKPAKSTTRHARTAQASASQEQEVVAKSSTVRSMRASTKKEPEPESKASAARTASARTATTKASSARAATVKSATGPTQSATAKTVPSRAASLKGSTTKSVSTKANTSRKASTSAKPVKQNVTTKMESSKTIMADNLAEESREEAKVEEETSNEKAEETQSGPQQVIVGDDLSNKNSTKIQLSSPTRLPRPVPPSPQLVSPFKLSLLSSVTGLGSVRKPAVSGALLASPSKATLSGDSPVKPTLMTASPVRLNASVRDFATGLGSPRRPGSSGSDQASPKRAIADEEASVLASAKRLRTSMSMPSLGSPHRSQASSSGSPPSPTKSSFRSPDKRPNLSPKKVSWHQTPPRSLAIKDATPPPRNPGILVGCVFFLDINSLTGTNQNCLFAGLVEELGGHSVQEWSHNNMGITHVLFMNGDIRTLEKVVASNGDVFCVSLGWLLDCQRENVRIPESQPRYLVDLACVPGHTPRPNRSALNTPMTSRTAPVSHTPALPPPKWALPSTPSIPREPLGNLSSSLLIKTPAFLATKTPGPPPSVGMGTIDELDKENVSPEPTPLIQKTCPPKQFNKSIFAMSGISATPVRNNKMLASKRRRSFDGIQKPALNKSVLNSPPRRPFALASPKKMSARSVLNPF